MKKSRPIVIIVAIAILLFAGSKILEDGNIPISIPSDFSDYSLPLNGDGTGYYRHCYEELSSDEKVIYSIILEELYSQPERVEIPDLGACDLQRIFNALSYDNPDLFNMGLNCEVYTENGKDYFSVEYTMDYETYKKYLDEATAVANAVAQQASQYSTDYEKEKYVHDYLINNCVYVSPEESSNSSSVYGCLVEGKASCEGYSRAFQLILGKLNIDNRLVTGEGTTDGVAYEPHMWNLVDVDDLWYFVDVTWDDPKGDESVLLYTYFNVTTNDILKKHRNIDQALPTCYATDNNYFVKEDRLFTNGSDDAFEAGIIETVADTVENGGDMFQLRFSSASVMNEAKNSLFEDGVIYDAYMDAGLIVSGGDSVSVNYITDEKMYTILVLL